MLVCSTLSSCQALPSPEEAQNAPSPSGAASQVLRRQGQSHFWLAILLLIKPKRLLLTAARAHREFLFISKSIRMPGTLLCSTVRPQPAEIILYQCQIVILGSFQPIHLRNSHLRVQPQGLHNHILCSGQDFSPVPVKIVEASVTAEEMGIKTPS